MKKEKLEKWGSCLGRVSFGIPFGAFGIFHFFKSEDLAGAVLRDWPMAQFLVIFTGVCLIAACLAIVTNKMTKTAAYLLALLLFVFIATLHLPAVIMATDEMSRMIPLIGLLKDMGLMGGALILAKNSH
jgi:putative oxidoreductase